jgi:AraC family transcriptional regulator
MLTKSLPLKNILLCTKKDPEWSDKNMIIKERKMPGIQVAFIHYKGSYEKIPELLATIVGWLIARNLQIQMPIYGTYYNNPTKVPPEEFEYEMGAAFLGEAEGEGDVKVKKIPEHMVLSTIYKGPYAEANSVYGAIFEYANSNGYQISGPVTEIYLNSPDAVSEEDDLLTEVIFPVVKK